MFGSSVVSCPECYQESSSDGQPTLPLSAVNPCEARWGKKGDMNEKIWAHSQRIFIFIIIIFFNGANKRFTCFKVERELSLSSHK